MAKDHHWACNFGDGTDAPCSCGVARRVEEKTRQEMHAAIVDATVIMSIGPGDQRLTMRDAWMRRYRLGV